MDAETWIALAAAVAVVAAIFAASQARSARRQAATAEQDLADNRVERDRAIAVQGRLAAIDFKDAPLSIIYARCTLTPKLAGLATGASVSAPKPRAPRCCGR